MKRRGAFQLPLPVIKLAIELGGTLLKVCLLPHCEVDILGMQSGKLRRAAVTECLICRQEFANEDRPGPTVKDDVVHHEDQAVLGFPRGPKPREEEAPGQGEMARARAAPIPQ